MKLLVVFILAVATTVSVEAVEPYVVPIYRVIMDAATTTVDPSATTTTTEATTTTTTATTTTETTTTETTTQAPRGRVVGKVEGHTLTHVCSGTLVDDSSIITTITCVELAMYETDMNPYVGTAADTSSAITDNKVLYEVLKIVKHPNYDSANNLNNIAVLKLTSEVDYSLSDKVSHITWALEVPALEASCVTSYWSADATMAQVNKVVAVKACDPVKDGAICSSYTPSPTVCPAGANGAALVCDSKLAGIFAPTRNSDCNAALWQYEELSKDAEWIWKSVSAAPILNVSFAAILALVTAMLKSL